MSSTTAKAQTLYDRSAQRWHEIADWVVANSLDLLLATIAAAIIVLALLALRRFGYKLIRDRRPDGEAPAISWQTIFGRVLARTNLFFIVMAALKLVAAQADAPPFLQRSIDILFIIAAALQAAIWGRELVLGLIEHRLKDEPDQGRLSSAIGIIRLFVTIALFAIAFIVILDNLDVDITGLVAGLGIGGIAIGLAAQGIFSDLFAAMAIIFDRPFRRGDTITFGTTTGTVEHIGLKTTRFRALGGEEVVMSNAKLLEQQLQNWALLHERRIVMQFGLIYQTPPDSLAQVPHEVKAIVEGLSRARFDRCHAFQFGASSIDFELVFYVTAPEFEVGMQVRQGVILGMMRRFAEIGVEFAYPTQTTFTAAPDGRMIMPYPPMGMFAVEPRAEGEEAPPAKV
jgi:small-conductance mechanosensitive channel